jgi:hypothetical protein
MHKGDLYTCISASVGTQEWCANLHMYVMYGAGTPRTMLNKVVNINGSRTVTKTSSESKLIFLLTVHALASLQECMVQTTHSSQAAV